LDGSIVVLQEPPGPPPDGGRASRGPDGDSRSASVRSTTMTWQWVRGVRPVFVAWRRRGTASGWCRRWQRLGSQFDSRADRRDRL